MHKSEGDQAPIEETFDLFSQTERTHCHLGSLNTLIHGS